MTGKSKNLKYLGIFFVSEALAERQRYQFSIDLLNTVPSRVSLFFSVLASAKGKFSKTIPCFFGWVCIRICFHSAILNGKYRNILPLDQPMLFSCINVWGKNIPPVFHRLGSFSNDDGDVLLSKTTDKFARASSFCRHRTTKT